MPSWLGKKENPNKWSIFKNNPKKNREVNTSRGWFPKPTGVEKPNFSLGSLIIPLILISITVAVGLTVTNSISQTIDIVENTTTKCSGSSGVGGATFCLNTNSTSNSLESTFKNVISLVSTFFVLAIVTAMIPLVISAFRRGGLV